MVNRLQAFLTDKGIVKAKRPNDYYYGKLRATLDKLPEPTVMDAILAMRKQGNTVFHRAYGTAKMTPLEASDQQYHEVCHLAAEFSHTVPGEVSLLAFEKGLIAGAGIREPEYIAEIQEKLKGNYLDYERRYSDMWNELYRDPSKTNIAVNVAAGMYLREKIDAFQQAGLLTPDKVDYGKQKAFCEAYAGHDHEISLGVKDDWPDIGNMPYALIRLSEPEWSAIRAVATGICEPDETQYPKRLQAVKEGLVALGHFHDVKPAMENAVRNHAANHPKGEAFDPERFKEARENRKRRISAETIQR